MIFSFSNVNVGLKKEKLRSWVWVTFFSQVTTLQIFVIVFLVTDVIAHLLVISLENVYMQDPARVILPSRGVDFFLPGAVTFCSVIFLQEIMIDRV